MEEKTEQNYLTDIKSVVTPKYDTTLWTSLIKNDNFEKLSLSERLEMVKNIGEGINFGYGRHFDIKPANIFFNEDPNGKWNGELVIADFGIGQRLSAEHGCGTGGFASLEQMVTKAGEKSDIYSMAKG